MVVEEIVDDDNRLVIRRITVGPLQTNCFALHAPRSRHAVLVDPGGEPDAILDAVADLRISAVVLTHTHWDHVEAVAQVADATGAPVAAHPADTCVWQHERRHLQDPRLLGRRHRNRRPPPRRLPAPPEPRPAAPERCHRHRAPRWRDPHRRTARHHRRPHPRPHAGGITLATPGHAFTGDTLFPGGPGLIGWPFSDFPTIITSIQSRLLTLPADTHVHPWQGKDTRIGDERPHLQAWIDRGW